MGQSGLVQATQLCFGRSFELRTLSGREADDQNKRMPLRILIARDDPDPPESYDIAN